MISLCGDFDEKTVQKSENLDDEQIHRNHQLKNKEKELDHIDHWDLLDAQRSKTVR